MDDFTKYERLRDQGASAKQIHAAAEADGLDPITSIRLIRKVCGLTLGEAKAVIMGDALEAKQAVKVGDTVQWEGWDTVQGFYLMEAKVADIAGDTVRVVDHKKRLVTESGLQDAVVDEPALQNIPMSFFDKTVAERLAESLRFALDAREPAPV